MAEKSDPPRAIRRGDWTPTRRYAVDTRTKLDRRGLKVARATASASALSSPSSPAPAVKQPAAPDSCPLSERSPSGTMSKGRDATTITDSTGRRRLTKLWDGGSRRALRAPRGRPPPPFMRRRPRDGVGSTAFWSCALALGLAAAREPLPPRRPPPASMLLRVGVGPTIRASGAEFSRPGDSAVGEPSLHTNGQRG